MTLLKRLAHSTLTFPLLAVILGPPNLCADTIYTTYEFTGTCSDCTGFGVGSLTLNNYTPGTSILRSEFVSFSYTSNLFSYSIPDSGELGFISGQLPDTMPGTAFIDIADTSNTPIVFVSFMSGSWCVGTNCGADNGTLSTWDSTQGAVPEPGSLSLIVPAAFGLMLFRRRRNRRF